MEVGRERILSTGPAPHSRVTGDWPEAVRSPQIRVRQARQRRECFLVLPIAIDLVALTLKLTHLFSTGGAYLRARHSAARRPPPHSATDDPAAHPHGFASALRGDSKWGRLMFDRSGSCPSTRIAASPTRGKSTARP